MSYDLSKKVYLFKKIAKRVYAQVQVEVQTKTPAVQNPEIQKQLDQIAAKFPKVKQYIESQISDSPEPTKAVKALQKEFKTRETGKIDDQLLNAIEEKLANIEFGLNYPKGQILELQKLMQRIPSYERILRPFGVDGIWGPRTIEAIVDLEKFLGLKVTSLPKKETIEKLKEYLRFGGLSAEQFAEIQALMMKKPEWAKIVKKIDGIWGKDSTKAMKEVQNFFNLPASGYPDENSIKKLREFSLKQESNAATKDISRQREPIETNTDRPKDSGPDSSKVSLPPNVPQWKIQEESGELKRQKGPTDLPEVPVK